MDPTPRRLGRRAALLLGAGALLGAAPTMPPDGPGLLVAGPDGGLIDQWAEWLEPAVRRVLAP